MGVDLVVEMTTAQQGRSALHLARGFSLIIMG